MDLFTRIEGWFSQVVEEIQSCFQSNEVQLPFQSVEVQLPSQSVEVMHIHTSFKTFDVSFKKNVSLCASWQTMSFLQKSSALIFLSQNREMVKDFNLSKLLHFVSPYHDLTLGAKNFPRHTAMMALLCVKLGVDVNTSRAVKIFHRAKGLRPQLSQNPSSVYFTPDGTTVDCDKEHFTHDQSIFRIYLRTCVDSSLKETFIRVKIPGASLCREIPVNPFQKDKEKQMISFCDAQGDPFCVFEISHEGLTSVHEPVTSHNYIHSRLPVRATLLSLCTGDSKVSLFHKDSTQPFAVYSLENGCICFNGNSLTGKPNESWKRKTIALMQFSNQGPMFAITVYNQMIFIDFDTQETIVQTVGSGVKFHPRLSLFWTPGLPDPNTLKMFKSRMWLKDDFSLDKAKPIAWGRLNHACGKNTLLPS